MKITTRDSASVGPVPIQREERDGGPGMLRSAFWTLVAAAGLITLGWLTMRACSIEDSQTYARPDVAARKAALIRADR